MENRCKSRSKTFTVKGSKVPKGGQMGLAYPLDPRFTCERPGSTVDCIGDVHSSNQEYWQ